MGFVMWKKQYFIGLTVGLLISANILTGTPAFAGGRHSEYHIPEGVYIDLDREFYEALKEDGQKQAKVYTNDTRTLYLMKILQNQQRIIHLLETLLEKEKK
jgi:hypothetical protein